MHQPRQREAPAALQPARVQAGTGRVRARGHRLVLHRVRGQPGRLGPDREEEHGHHLPPRRGVHVPRDHLRAGCAEALPGSRR